MNARHLLLLCLAWGGARLGAVENVTVGVLAAPEAREVAEAVELELQKLPGVELVERGDLSAALAEQGLAVAGLTLGGSVEAGRLSRAEILLIVARERLEAGESLVLRCVRTSPGVIAWQHFLAAKTAPEAVAALVAERLASTLAGARVPGVIVSVPAPAVGFAGGDAVRRGQEFHRALLHRLAAQPGVWVLERQRIEALAWEGALEGGDFISRRLDAVIACQLSHPPGRPGELEVTASGAGRLVVLEGRRDAAGELGTRLAVVLFPEIKGAGEADVTAEARLMSRAALDAEERLADWRYVDELSAGAFFLGDRSHATVSLRAMSLLRRACGLRVFIQGNFRDPVNSFVPAGVLDGVWREVALHPERLPEALGLATEAMNVYAGHLPDFGGSKGARVFGKLWVAQHAVIAHALLRAAVGGPTGKTSAGEIAALRQALRRLCSAVVQPERDADGGADMAALMLLGAGYWADSVAEVFALQKDALADYRKLAPQDVGALDVFFGAPPSFSTGAVGTRRGALPQPREQTIHFVAATGEGGEGFQPLLDAEAHVRLAGSENDYEGLVAFRHLYQRDQLTAEERRAILPLLAWALETPGSRAETRLREEPRVTLIDAARAFDPRATASMLVDYAEKFAAIKDRQASILSWTAPFELLLTALNDCAPTAEEARRFAAAMQQLRAPDHPAHRALPPGITDRHGRLVEQGGFYDELVKLLTRVPGGMPELFVTTVPAPQLDAQAVRETRKTRLVWEAPDPAGTRQIHFLLGPHPGDVAGRVLIRQPRTALTLVDCNHGTASEMALPERETPADREAYQRLTMVRPRNGRARSGNHWLLLRPPGRTVDWALLVSDWPAGTWRKIRGVPDFDDEVLVGDLLYAIYEDRGSKEAWGHLVIDLMNGEWRLLTHSGGRDGLPDVGTKKPTNITAGGDGRIVLEGKRPLRYDPATGGIEPLDPTRRKSLPSAPEPEELAARKVTYKLLPDGSGSEPMRGWEAWAPLLETPGVAHLVSRWHGAVKECLPITALPEALRDAAIEKIPGRDELLFIAPVKFVRGRTVQAVATLSYKEEDWVAAAQK